MWQIPWVGSAGGCRGSDVCDCSFDQGCRAAAELVCALPQQGSFCSRPVPQQRLNSTVTVNVSDVCRIQYWLTSSSSLFLQQYFWILLGLYLSLCFGSVMSSHCAHSSRSWNSFWRGGCVFELLCYRKCVCARMCNEDGYLINKIYVASASAYCSQYGFS